MSVYLRRFPLMSWIAALCTIGYLWVENDEGMQVFSCFTIELPWRNNNVKTSCVPCATYPLVWEFSQHFGRNLWEVKNVPGRDEAKIHPANRVSELLGCIGLGDGIGMETAGWFVTNSRPTVERFHAAMHGYEKATLTIWQD